jgi:predicted Zn-dependent protease
MLYLKKSLLGLSLCFCITSNTLQAQDFLLNLVPISQDKELGRQVSQQIESDPKIKILDEKQYAEAYAYLRNMTKSILESGQVANAKNFDWQVKIIHDDKTLNAFCTPGGYIYVYTGLIKYLDNEDHLAGVMGHEIAHADRRHSTRQLIQNQGVNIITEIALGKNKNALVQMAQNLIALRFSRTDESDADACSVRYLCATQYQADGAAGFFEKLNSQGQGGGTPEFLSTHPSPTNRVRAIRADAGKRQCKSATVRRDGTAYQRFKAMLPK